MHADLAGIDRRKEIATDEWERDEGAAEQNSERGEDGEAMAERPGERVHVEAAEALEAVVKALVDAREKAVRRGVFRRVRFAGEQVFNQHGNDRAAEDIAREDGENDRER